MSLQLRVEKGDSGEGLVDIVREAETDEVWRKERRRWNSRIEEE